MVVLAAGAIALGCYGDRLPEVDAASCAAGASRCEQGRLETCDGSPWTLVDDCVARGATCRDSGSGPARCESAGVAGEVVCGRELCDVRTQICLGCDHGDTRDVHCVSRDGASFWETTGPQAAAHGCDYFGSVFIECDDPGDCGLGSHVCVFSGGEAGYAFCGEAGTYTHGAACRESAECSPEAPVCGQIDPFGYFSPYADLLGWMPRGCYTVSELCTNLCYHPCSDAGGRCTAGCWTDLQDCSTSELDDLDTCSAGPSCDFLTCVRAVGCIDGGWGFF